MLCALSSVVGTFVAGMFSTALHLEQPELPRQVDMQLMGVLCFVSGIVLSIALVELSHRLPGNRWSRFAVIAWFVFAWQGINNTIEAHCFMTMGGGSTVIVTMLFSSVFVSGLAVLLFGGQGSGESFSARFRRFFARRTTAQWTFRLSAAVLAFPIVYFVFGMPVGLLVGEHYRNHEFGLQLPSSVSEIFGVQCIRGMISLSAALLILVAWPGSRRRFAWTFGSSLFVVSGLYELIQAYWFPWAMRGIHCVELLLDSLAYGWLLAALLLPRAPAHDPVPVEETGVRNYTI